MASWHQGRAEGLDAVLAKTLPQTQKQLVSLARPVPRTEGPQDRRVENVWVLSDFDRAGKDPHKFVRKLGITGAQNDVLLVTGGISGDLDVTRKVLRLLRPAFARVFFVPGAAELDLSYERGAKCRDSLDKLVSLEQLCQEEDVDTRPQRLLRKDKGTCWMWVVPLVSWLTPTVLHDKKAGEHRQAFQKSASGAVFAPPLGCMDGSAANFLDSVNDHRAYQKGLETHGVSGTPASRLEEIFVGCRRDPDDVVVSFSAFWPKSALGSGDRFMYHPSLVQVSGSAALGERVDRMRPNVHVFGYTPLGWDQMQNGVRMIAAPSVPGERARTHYLWGHASGFSPPKMATCSAFFCEPSSMNGLNVANGTSKHTDATFENIWIVSDLVVDGSLNENVLTNVVRMGRDSLRDVLLITGDIAEDVKEIKAALAYAKSKFGWVFYVPGGRDFWCKQGDVAWATGRQGCPPVFPDSWKKLSAVLQCCEALGVHTGPKRLASAGGSGVWIVPIVSYHDPRFNKEPPIDPRWKGLLSPETICADSARCVWLPCADDVDVAIKVDAVNDELLRKCKCSPFPEHRSPHDWVITLSHYLPSPELLPEKKFLPIPAFADVSGSCTLQARMRAVAPNVHVSSCSPFAWDGPVQNVRHVVAPKTGHCSRRSPEKALMGSEYCDSELAIAPQPLLLWGAQGHKFAPQYTTAWEKFYREEQRGPDNARLPEHVASLYEWRPESVEDYAKVGWAKREPPWNLVPSWV